MVYDCGKYKITLKKVIRRLETISDDSRNMWLSEILSHFGNKCGGFKYAQGFEQGLLEGFVNGLNETKSENTPVQVPKVIANWIDYCKSCSITLYGALDPVDKFGMSIAETFNGDAQKCAKWARSNSNDFAYAWVNGYEVDDKYYYIVIPCGEGTYRRVFMNSNRNLVISGFTYHSEEEAREVSKDSSFKLTEKIVKDSELSWVWQFAKELEI